MKANKALVNKLAKGDIRAFDQLFEQYSQRLYAFAFKYLKSEVEAEGLVQEVFIKIWNKRQQLNADKSFHSYLFTIAFNQVKKHFEKRQVIHNMVDVLAPDIADDSTEKGILYRSILHQVIDLLNELPEKKRKIFEMSRFQGLPSKEIAKNIGLAPKTVDNQISEVIHYLKERVDISDIAVVLMIFMMY
ncbi:RNA polymerase sigma-70 factor [Carboxylicivirga sediminis]|uniref:RNA polymerase sigma-70 factor n=1 Tax=Carboxylicivirga sediminis TaxID=2006564 RepID=A0A941IT37_9BACT|nr:RNA polymerase sigma-70 factor [Carboxylicivirga sediminis]MBR8534121.1 RNA polymerase sigma-70 factor [Carboxylicivirga sediminis]